MAGVIESEGPLPRREPRLRRSRDRDPEVDEADLLRRLRIAGLSAGVMAEAETRMRADPAHGRSWAEAQLYRPRDRQAGLLCACGDELVGQGWQGEATVRCSECGSRWWLGASGGSSRWVMLSGPSDEWLDSARPLPEVAPGPHGDGVPGDERERLARYLRVDPRLQDALDPVIADLRATTTFRPTIEAWRTPGDLDASAMLWVGDKSSVRVWVSSDDDIAERIRLVAEQVQEWAVEALWELGLPATWPECPRHPDSHPLEAWVTDGLATWRCPRGADTVLAIGSLGGAGRQSDRGNQP